MKEVRDKNALFNKIKFNSCKKITIKNVNKI